MKLNLTRKLARQVLFTQNLLIALIPLGVIEILWYFGLITQDPYLILAGFIIQPVIITVLRYYRIKKNHDGDLLRKWEEKRQKKIANKKEEITGLNSKIRELYEIFKIIPEVNKMCVFRITFYNQLNLKVMPEIYLFGIKLPLEQVGNFEVICYATSAVTADIVNLVFESGNSIYSIKNPYHIKDEIQKSDIVWQNEGSTKEKNIFIKSDCFPNINSNVLYPFILFIDGKRIGEYDGKHDPKTNSLCVNIGNITKKDCGGKKCIIKPSFDHRKKAELPIPSVISLNNTQVRQVSF